MAQSPVEVFLSSVAYAAAIVAMLRAGSRATYMLTHGGRMGIVDGPLILGPEDVRHKRKEKILASREAAADGANGVDCDEFAGEDAGTGSSNSHSDEDDVPEVSPLWESSYGFQQAVRLAQHIASGRQGTQRQREDNDDDDISWTGKIKYIPIDKDLDGVKGKRKGALAKLLAGKEDTPYSLSPRASVQQITDDRRDTGGNNERLKLSFDWHRGTASWVGSTGGISRRGTLLQRLSGDGIAVGGKGGDGLDFNLMASSTVEIPNSDCDDDTDSIQKPDRVAHISVYAPAAFARLRRMFGVTEHDYLRSMMKKYVSFQSNSKGAARAGLFFFFTRDGAYMIKTIKKDEAKTFSRILPKYYEFMKRNAKRSLLTRFCGMYSVKVTDSTDDGTEKDSSKEKEHVFIVMNSVFPAEASKFVSERFDLKGSTVGRQCSVKEREEKGPNAVLKDLDLAREVSAAASEQSILDEPTYGINIGSRTKKSLLAQLRRDVALLEECQVMDYSLLVGVVRSKDDPQNILIDQQRQNDILLPYGLLNLREDSLVERIISSPVGKKVHWVVDRALWWVLPNSMPYYGAGVCGVDGGVLSIIPGRRSGHRAVYYMGIIDFLQPWTWKKVMENEIKGLVGYNTRAISCVSPKDYAARFLDFIDAHIT